MGRGGGTYPDTRQMGLIATMLWLANMTVDTIGHLSFKMATLMAGDEDGIQHWLRLLKQIPLWVGRTAFTFEFVLWIAFLSYVPLSVGVMVGSINMIAVMVGGRLLFNEKLVPARVAAIGLITVGVVLVGWGGA